MVILSISIKIHPGKRSELLDTCRMIIDKIRHEKGCRDIRLSQDIHQENLIYLGETWEERPQLDAHFRSDIFSALLGAVKLLGETHEFQIHDGSTTEGIEAIQSARSKCGTNDPL